jgi:trehalose 6-phosphate phosphatase
MRTRSLVENGIWESVRAALRRTSRPGRPILVVLDFDGTVAPIASRPDRVRVPAGTLREIERAARLRGVRVAALSARPLRDLARYLPVRGVLRVAQYGLEGVDPLRPERRKTIRAGVERLRELLEPVVERQPGAWIEDKRLTVAVHYRDLSPRRRAALLRDLAPILSRARRLGFHAERGRRVIDFVPSPYDKGRALRSLRRRVRPAVTFYFGDTAGDEPAFAALGKTDFPVRVGAGPTAAPYRVRGPGDVARFLRALVALRTGSKN